MAEASRSRRPPYIMNLTPSGRAPGIVGFLEPALENHKPQALASTVASRKAVAFLAFRLPIAAHGPVYSKPKVPPARREKPARKVKITEKLGRIPPPGDASPENR